MHIAAGTPERAAEASGLLARAFLDDPGTALFFPGHGRLAALQAHFHGLLAYPPATALLGFCEESGRLEACAVQLPPRGAAAPRATERPFGRPARRPLPLRAALRMMLATPTLHCLARRACPADAWTLLAIGVEPDVRGRGRGGELLRRLLEELDARGAPCYLETMAPRNLTFYRRHGFRLVGRARPPGSLPTYALLRRPPRIAAGAGSPVASRRLTT